MNLDKFTDRARGFLQAAQTIAIREGHQRFLPEHLLKAMLDDREGAASALISRAEGDAAAAKAAVDAAVAKLPSVQGGDGQLYMDGATAKLILEAENLSEKAGDSYVTAERLLTALALAKTTEAGKALAAGGVTPQKLNAAINDIRKGRKADSAGAEQNFDALQKYARDLTEDARQGRLDPVIGRDEEIRRTI